MRVVARLCAVRTPGACIPPKSPCNQSDEITTLAWAASHFHACCLVMLLSCTPDPDGSFSRAVTIGYEPSLSCVAAGQQAGEGDRSRQRGGHAAGRRGLRGAGSPARRVHSAGGLREAAVATVEDGGRVTAGKTCVATGIWQR